MTVLLAVNSYHLRYTSSIPKYFVTTFQPVEDTISCKTSLMRFTKDRKRRLDDKRIVAVVELSKAFDKMPPH